MKVCALTGVLVLTELGGLNCCCRPVEMSAQYGDSGLGAAVPSDLRIVAAIPLGNAFSTAGSENADVRLAGLPDLAMYDAWCSAFVMQEAAS